MSGKAVALHGLGVHVYSGEDIAEIPDNLGEEEKGTEAKTINPTEIKEDFAPKIRKWRRKKKVLPL